MKNKSSQKGSCLAVFGTGSDVGKSIVATALCRCFVDRGFRTAPYKAQNMSNNSGVTPEGLEMGRAQIVQAEAARIPPHVDMNPVLLKPTSDIGSQVVLLGKILENSTAAEYHRKKEHLFSTAANALDRLREKYDVVVMEGAGSCAEINLMDHDIVNLPMAEYAQAPVILVADIHKGGVFAQIVGTLACLPEKHRDRIAGFIINRFRGDISLFEDGVNWIEGETGKKVFGVLPWYKHIRIEAEDSVVIENPGRNQQPVGNEPVIAVVRLPHISNFTDFEPLDGFKGVSLKFIENIEDLLSYRAVILPGSKSTRSDLDWLKVTGWDKKICQYAGSGGHILGICGGYQLLGTMVHDPEGIEGRPGSTPGLGLLPVETELKAPKTTTLTRFNRREISGTGYEIHMGRTLRKGGLPLFSVNTRNGEACREEDGCITADGRIAGTYMHGLFDSPGVTRHWLESIGLGNINVPEIYGPDARDHEYDLLAEHFSQHVNIEGIQRYLTRPKSDF